MSNSNSINSILSKLGYPTIPKDGTSIMSSLISPINSIVNSPSTSNVGIQLMDNIDSPSMSTYPPLQLCLVDFNVSPLNIGGNQGVDGDMIAIINKPYTLIVGILQGTLPPNSILSVSGSDGSKYNISNKY